MQIHIITAPPGEDGYTWVGLYRNGTLYHQGPAIPTKVWLELLDVEGTTEELNGAAFDEMGGEFPPRLLDVQREATPQGRVDLDNLNTAGS